MKYLNLISILFLFSCSASDNYKELSKGYFYASDCNECAKITPPNIKYPIIHSEVVRYNYNDDFILAIQRPSKKYILADIQDSLRKNKSITKKIEIQSDSILKNNFYYKNIFSREINYWIIDLKDTILLGPYSKNEYLNKCKLLNINKNLYDF